MKAASIRFVLGKGSDYKDLAPVYPEILRMLLEEIEQVPEDEEIMEMFVELSVSDLVRNRKPEGYNRKGRIRMIFPTDRKEFYIKAYSKNSDPGPLGDRIADVLRDAGVDFKVEKDD